MTAIVSLHYLPCIEYFICFIKYDKIYIEAAENYIKQSYRNRCLIKSSQKIDTLTIPVHRGNSKINVKEIEIDYSQGWVNNHIRAIQSAYGKSPFFEHYKDLFFDVLLQKPSRLFDLNFRLLTLCLKLLQIETPLSLTTTYEKEPAPAIKDYRNRIHPKISFIKNDLLKACRYNQVFGSNFAENMSIIDLLFCEGPNARPILLNSTIE